MAIDPTASNSSLKRRLFAEMKEFAGIFLYLVVAFGFYAICEDVVRRREGVEISAQGFALINALVFGKVILVAENLKFGQWLRSGPLVYPIALESALYAGLLLVFHYFEHWLLGFFRGAESGEGVGGGGLLGLVLVYVLLFVGLAPLFAYRNLARALGPQRLRALLFGGSVEE